MPFIQLPSNLTLHYLDFQPKNAKTILLLHGLGASGESWGYQIPMLEQAGYRILAPDTRGFGKSGYPGGRHTIPILASDFVALLDALSVNKISLMGISMGGTLALQMALDHPQRITRLVLVNTFARLRPRSPSVWVYFLWRLFLVHIVGLPAQARTVSQRIFPRPEQAFERQMLYEQVCQANPRGYRASMRALARFDVFHRLNEIAIPTLVVTGDRDTTVPASNQAELAAQIRGAQQVIIPDAGHGVIADQPQVFNQTLLDFLREGQTDSF